MSCYSAVEMYLEFACCDAVPGSGRNKEHALHLLQLYSGDIHVRYAAFKAILKPYFTRL